MRPRAATRRRPGSDHQLVERVRAGDQLAFETIYDRYHAGLLGFCRHMLGSQPEAEDALQLVFLSAHRALSGDERQIELRPWLYTIARNRCTSMLRARRDELPLEVDRRPSTAGLALADQVERREELHQLLGDVGRLPEHQRAALVLAELGDLPHAEIAMTLQVPTAKVKALIFQARERLIGARRARETPCAEIREQLATLRGGALRRTAITQHLAACPGCRTFADDVGAQRAALGCVLPIAPAVALKGPLLAAVASGGGGVAAGTGAGVAAAALSTTGAGSTVGAAGGAATAAGVAGAAAGGTAGSIAVVTGTGVSVGAGKAVAAVVAAIAVAGGGVAVERTVDPTPPPAPAGQSRQAAPRPAASTPGSPSRAVAPPAGGRGTAPAGAPGRSSSETRARAEAAGRRTARARAARRQARAAASRSAKRQRRAEAATGARQGRPAAASGRAATAASRPSSGASPSIRPRPTPTAPRRAPRVASPAGSGAGRTTPRPTRSAAPATRDSARTPARVQRPARGERPSPAARP